MRTSSLQTTLALEPVRQTEQVVAKVPVVHFVNGIPLSQHPKGAACGLYPFLVKVFVDRPGQSPAHVGSWLARTADKRIALEAEAHRRGLRTESYSADPREATRRCGPGVKMYSQPLRLLRSETGNLPERCIVHLERR